MHNFWVLVAITCLSMVLKDAVGIFGTIAEAKGNAALEAVLNPIGTVAGVAFFSYGAVTLLQTYHWKGVLGLIPVLIVDAVDGYYFTKWGRQIKGSDYKRPHVPPLTHRGDHPRK